MLCIGNYVFQPLQTGRLSSSCSCTSISVLNYPCRHVVRLRCSMVIIEDYNSQHHRRGHHHHDAVEIGAYQSNETHINERLYCRCYQQKEIQNTRDLSEWIHFKKLKTNWSGVGLSRKLKSKFSKQETVCNIVWQVSGPKNLQHKYVGIQYIVYGVLQNTNITCIVNEKEHAEG